MQFATPLMPATFVRRLNRFAALCRVDGGEVLAHVPNSGRLGELFVAGAPCLLSQPPRLGAARKTFCNLALVRYQSEWVCVDARLPARLLAEALARGTLPAFIGMHVARYEIVYGDSRLDLLLDGPSGQCLVETKCVTLVRDGVALFPDAPTERGRRHVETLARAAGSGLRAAVVFVIQRADAEAFALNDATDPAFSDALRRATERGVGLYAYRCHVTADEVRLDAGVSVRL